VLKLFDKNKDKSKRRIPNIDVYTLPRFFQIPFGKKATKHAKSPIHTQTITCEPLLAIIGPSFIVFLH
jgi:hypothetical protein